MKENTNLQAKITAKNRCVYANGKSEVNVDLVDLCMFKYYFFKLKTMTKRHNNNFLFSSRYIATINKTFFLVGICYFF